jgi:hypothetical protein
MPTAGSAAVCKHEILPEGSSESLHMDVMTTNSGTVSLSGALHIATFTKILRSGDNNGLTYWMNPSAVVEYSINCPNRGQVVCIPGIANRTLCLLATTLPRSLYYQIAGIRRKSEGKTAFDTTCVQAVN